MVKLTQFTGNKSQLYYLTDTNLGVCPVWGPFMWDFELGLPTPSSVTTFDFGPPTDSHNSGTIADLFDDFPSSYGEHSCSHTNASGDVFILGRQLSTQKFHFALASDARVSGEGWWFSDVDFKLKKYKSKPIGYGINSSDLKLPKDLGILQIQRFFLATGATGSFEESSSLSYSYRLPASLSGSWSVTAKGSSFEWKYDIHIDEFIPPSTIRWRVYKNGILETGGLNPLTMVPVSMSGQVYPDISQKDVANALMYPLSFLEHSSIDYGSLAQSAVASLRYTQTNMLENAVGWADVRSIAPPAELLTNPRNPKNLAKLYLWYKYSFMPNVKDFPEAIDVIKANSSGFWRDSYQVRYDTAWSSSANRLGNVTTRGNIRIRLRPEYYTAMQSIAGSLRSAGLSLSPDNLWDLVPFSFVIDWFCPVGKFISTLLFDFSTTLNTYHIKDVIISSKSYQDVNINDINKRLVGILTYTIYDRRVSQTLPPPSYEFGRKNPLRHMLEGIALIIANW